MKKLVLVAVSWVLGITVAFSQPKKFQDIVGKWDIAGEQNTGATLEIIDSTNIVLTYMGEKKKILDYRIDFSKSPIWFDFTTQDTASIVNVKSLLEVVNESMIKWQLFVDEERPSHFSSSKGELFYLTKGRKSADAGNVIVKQR
jgi:hypothetical protein